MPARSRVPPHTPTNSLHQLNHRRPPLPSAWTQGNDGTKPAQTKPELQPPQRTGGPAAGPADGRSQAGPHWLTHSMMHAQHHACMPRERAAWRKARAGLAWRAGVHASLHHAHTLHMHSNTLCTCTAPRTRTDRHMEERKVQASIDASGMHRAHAQTRTRCRDADTSSSSSMWASTHPIARGTRMSTWCAWQVACTHTHAAQHACMHVAQPRRWKAPSGTDKIDESNRESA
jgi:hypothetical protein